MNAPDSPLGGHDETRRQLHELARVVSHDFRAPIRAILTAADVVGEATLGTASAGGPHVAMLTKAANRLEALSSGLAHYTWVVRRSRPLQPIDLEEVYEAAEELLAEDFALAEVSLERAPLPTVACDEILLSWVFYHLVANAILFGGERPEVRIECETADGVHTVSVHDNGSGIAAEDRDTALKLMKQLGAESQARLGKSRVGGSGVGLAASEAIVTRHGGRLWSESSPLGGEVFRFSLPVAG